MFPRRSAVLAGAPSPRKPSKSGALTRLARLGPRAPARAGPPGRAHCRCQLARWLPVSSSDTPPSPGWPGMGWDGAEERSLGELERKRRGGNSSASVLTGPAPPPGNSALALGASVSGTEAGEGDPQRCQASGREDRWVTHQAPSMHRDRRANGVRDGAPEPS